MTFHFTFGEKLWSFGFLYSDIAEGICPLGSYHGLLPGKRNGPRKSPRPNDFNKTMVWVRPRKNKCETNKAVNITSALRTIKRKLLLVKTNFSDNIRRRQHNTNNRTLDDYLVQNWVLDHYTTTRPIRFIGIGLHRKSPYTSAR